MKVTRRNVLIGLGALSGGAGLIGGTGAFDTVQADREFDVQLDDDADALLELRVLDETYANLDDGIIQIAIGTDDNSGINDEAVTVFNDLFSVGNNGTQNVDVWFDTVDGVVFETSGGTDLTNSDNAVTVPAGATAESGSEDVLEVALKIDTRSGDNAAYGEYTEPEDEPYTITIHAATDA